jgi:hypothetical protein
MAAAEKSKKYNGSDARYVASFEKQLTEAQHRYYVIVLKHSPRHEAALDAL